MKKTSEAMPLFGASEVYPLHQHPDRVFQKPRQRLHELRGFGSIANAVIHGDGGFHAPAGFDLSVFHDWDFSGRTDCQYRRFGRIDDGNEILDIIHSAASSRNQNLLPQMKRMKAIRFFSIPFISFICG
jgi:hypothetical protein